ncbi:glutathione S-transferase family protein [Vannielia litorea]|uniref:glutathione S-transferase family protein n=1 Tax=Vannielia litorea TaxID=1217970 RepID=UPI001C939E6F|nr:glutathione S-transferase family protein [Vannielia litorea]MBY6154328.1 glutathione S-transferase family protein [Vannielia litorea]
MPQPDILLYTANTMNGWKPLIFLHEAEIDYELRPVDFGKKEQKETWYMELNPNGRIPTIVDRGNDDFAVFESGAILWYLAEKYGRFLPDDPKLRSETLQWVMFQMGGIGPMMGQAMFFQRIAKPNGEEVPYAINRYVNESRRLLEVLDTRLKGRDWLVGDEMSIADIATYPWARTYFWATVSVEGLPHLNRWFERIDAMPRVQEALQLPEPRPAAFGKGDIDAAASANAARFKE